MSRKPCSRKLRAADSSTCSNVGVGHGDRSRKAHVRRRRARCCLRARRRSPAPPARCRAPARSCSASALTRTLCLPSTMCGPFCSVPPIGTMTVVFPARIWSRSSVQVSSSRNTVAGAAAGTPVAAASRKRAPNHGAARIMSLHYEAAARESGNVAAPRHGPRRVARRVAVRFQLLVQPDRLPLLAQAQVEHFHAPRRRPSRSRCSPSGCAARSLRRSARRRSGSGTTAPAS